MVWLNLLELSKLDSFATLLEKVTAAEKEWKVWSDSDAPEEEDIPSGYATSLDIFKYEEISYIWLINFVRKRKLVKFINFV